MPLDLKTWLFLLLELLLFVAETTASGASIAAVVVAAVGVVGSVGSVDTVAAAAAAFAFGAYVCVVIHLAVRRGICRFRTRTFRINEDHFPFFVNFEDMFVLAVVVVVGTSRAK